MFTKKLTNEDVARIRLNTEGWTTVKWAKEFDVSQSVISRAKTGATHKGCEVQPDTIRTKRDARKLTPEQVIDIRDNPNNRTWKELINIHKLPSSATIQRIRKREIYKEI
jgi:transposase